MAGLDGIRGLSALAVLLFHAGVEWLPAGFLGVDVFFIVSGFLITSLLLSERERDGRVDLTQFWLRRARRLLPVLALVLIATTTYAAIALHSELIPHLREAAAAAAYITNWDLVLRDVSYWDSFARPSQLRHLWSLAVEEQFYIVWPIVFAGLAALAPRGSLRVVICAVVLSIAIGSAYLMAVLHQPDQDASRVYFGTDARAFTILIGVALACVWQPWRWNTRLLERRSVGYGTALLGFVGAGGLVLLMLSANPADDWLYPYGLIAMSVCAAALVAAVANQGSIADRLLGMGALRWLGERSYSIYLWHWPVLLALTWDFDFSYGSLDLILLGAAITFVLAEASFRIVESPMRRPEFWTRVRHPAILTPRVRRSTYWVAVGSLFAAVLCAVLLLPSSRTDGDTTSAFESAIAAQSEDEEASSRDNDTTDLDRAAGVDTAESDSETPVPLIVATRSGQQSRSTADRQYRATETTSAVASPQPESTQEDSTDGASIPDPGSSSTTGDSQTEEVARPPSGNVESAADGDWTMVYVVQAGDSPNRLVNLFGVSAETLIEFNGERVMRVIHPGDHVRIPCPDGRACALVEIEPERGTCIDWQGAGHEGETCERAMVLIHTPARFTIGPVGAFSNEPEWTWQGERVSGNEFNLTTEMLEELDGIGPEAAQPTLRGVSGIGPLAVGDSVMRGAVSALAEAGLEVDAVGARSARQSMAAIAKHLETRGHDRTIVFQGIGYNFQTHDDLDDLMHLLKDVPHVILLTHQFPQMPPWRDLESTINETLRTRIGQYENVTLVDWHEISEGRQDELTFDGAHLTSAGIDIYVGAIVDAINRIQDRQDREGSALISVDTSETAIDAAPSSETTRQATPEPVVSTRQPAVQGTRPPVTEPASKQSEEETAKLATTATSEATAKPVTEPSREPRSKPNVQGTAQAVVNEESKLEVPDYWFEYVVRQGDVPYNIARTFGAELADLRLLNGEDYYDWMLVGNRIKVPCPGSLPCRVITVEPTGGSCVDWQTRSTSRVVCSPAAILADFPVQFGQRDRSPLVDVPLWRWSGGEQRSAQLTITQSMSIDAPDGKWFLKMEPNLPPLAVGDSVMVGARVALQEAGIDVDAVVGIGFPQALRLLEQNLARNGQRDVVIFQSVGNNFDDEEAFQRLLRAAGDAKHLIVLTRNLGFRPEILHVERRINQMLRQEAAKFDWVTLLDWREAVDGRQAELTFDGTHLNARGITMYTDLVLAAITGGP
ncbi:MAG: acyltransferase family protein [Chloroflexi bacterium]|nr:acyltransferase family protein [Chloroflexota bacterium]